jgi:tetratricopeptide (TPR) repeat protein
MHAQARDLMARKNWQDAIQLWRHLHTRKLVSQALYLDAATCFAELKQPDDALKVLQEAYGVFSETAPADWLEQCGDLACKLGPPAEALAVKAYEQASQRLRDTTSGRKEREPRGPK